MRTPSTLLSVWLAAGFAGPASADAPSPAQAYLDTPAIQETARLALRDAATRAMPPCPDYRADDATRVFYKPLRVQDGQATAGLFRETATVRGCGMTRRISVLAFVREGGRIERLPLLPGTTLSDPVIQREAIPYAISGAYAKIPDRCHDIQVRNTDFIGYDPTSLEGKKPWREVWTVDACKTSIAVDMLFRPDAEGTTVIARPHRP
jgi:hypothetical protein